MPELTEARQQYADRQELLAAMERLINTIAVKTQTIQRQQQQLGILFQSIDTICDLVQAGRFDELTDLITMYLSVKTTKPKNLKVH